MREYLPVLGICGFSGSGKTTLIEKVLPLLITKGLKVAVVKHDVHGIQVDTPGKDSDRLFKAGATLLLQGPEEEFLRAHRPNDINFIQHLRVLCRQHDLVLIEGHKDSPLPKVWLLSDGENTAPSDKQEILATLSRDITCTPPGRVYTPEGNREKKFMTLLDEWLPRQHRKTPLYGCVLIGGKSCRMGKPKHLLAKEGKTWLEQTVERVATVTDQVVIAGAGTIPKNLASYTCLPDISEVKGPMAGILSAMRWEPEANWLVAACDMPDISLNALRWLISSCSPGEWGVLPRLAAGADVEPLLAYYDYRAALLLEKLAEGGQFSLQRIVPHPKIATPVPPEDLCKAWRNVNTEAELG